MQRLHPEVASRRFASLGAAKRRWDTGVQRGRAGVPMIGSGNSAYGMVSPEGCSCRSGQWTKLPNGRLFRLPAPASR